ncbi:MAG TPA: hypothetical protein DCE41_03625 [Cytophagales bacterium]|nr:hypothetical protein [Cytophagales bacterium]HAA21642.1 hypothetical protein [Cytophagales bacterium]HAP60433.1 hypothetical protein [Cytophagales bacterium]
MGYGESASTSSLLFMLEFGGLQIEKMATCVSVEVGRVNESRTLVSELFRKLINGLRLPKGDSLAT